METAKKHALWVVLASSTLTIMAGAIIAPVLNLMREGLNVDPALVGTIITTHGLFIALFSPLMGSLIDRIGPRIPFIAGLCLYGVAGGSGLIINSFWMLMISRAILGIALAAFFNAITVLILNLFEEVERDRVMGWRGSSTSLGGIAWPLLGGFLGSLSWHLPFAVYFLGLPIGCLAFLTIPKVEFRKTDSRVGDVTVRGLFRGKPVLFFIYGFMFMTNLFLYALVIFLTQRLGQIGLTNPFHIGIFISISTVAAGITSLNYAKIKSRLGYWRIVFIALILWTTTFGAISMTSMLPVIGIAVAIYGVGQGMVFPSIPLWIGESVPRAFRGRFSSYIGTSGFIGQFMSPIIFSPVLILLGLNSIFMVISITCFLLLIIIFLLMKGRI